MELVFAHQTGHVAVNAASTVADKNHTIIPTTTNQLVVLPQDHTLVCAAAFCTEIAKYKVLLTIPINWRRALVSTR